MLKFLTILAIVIASFIAKAQKLSLLTSHVVLTGQNNTYESGDSTVYFYSGLRGHGGLYHTDVDYDSAILFKFNSFPQQYYAEGMRYYKTFDSFDNTLISISAMSGGTWQKDSNSYGSYNNLIFNLHSYKPNNSSTFINNAETEYFYNPDSTLNYIATSSLNMVTNVWEPLIDTYTYANKNLVHRLIKKWDNGNWVNILQISRSYVGNKQKQLIVEQWANSYWVVGEKHVYNYNSNNLLVEDSAGTHNVDSFFYDANNKLILKAHWSMLNGKFNLWNDSFEYDTLNRLVLHTRFTWPLSGPKWYSSGECGDKYYYNDTPAVVPVAIRSIDLSKKLVLYPNPATKELNIKHSLSGDRAIEWSVVNALGRNMRQWATTGNASQVVDLSNLPPGLYYLNFTSGSDKGSKQFVLIE